MDTRSVALRLERYISCSEIAYKDGRTCEAIRNAKYALKICDEHGKAIALRIFIARAYSKIGKYAESNKIYRALLREQIYIPPVIMGLFYNNFKSSSTKKMELNMKLVKTCLMMPVK